MRNFKEGLSKPDEQYSINKSDIIKIVNPFHFVQLFDFVLFFMVFSMICLFGSMI